MGEPEGMFRNMESLETLISTKPIQPTIINPNSNFVMITYWWGRDRLNKNMQLPCPEDIKNPSNALIKDPITYDEMIKIWIK